MTRPVLRFVGTGGMGQQAHLANDVQLRDARRCEIAGVVDLQRDLAGAVAAAYGFDASGSRDLLQRMRRCCCRSSVKVSMRGAGVRQPSWGRGTAKYSPRNV